jgi:hypothetical protein
MGKKSSKAPKAPDPVKVASAQTATNIGTALAEGAINRVNQVTPDGSLTYSQTGTTTWRDPLSGRVYEIPNMTATTTLSEAQQKIKTEADAAEYNLANAANFMSGKLSKEPFKVNEEVEGRLFDLGMKRLQPQLDLAYRRAQNEAVNKGYGEGSDAYNAVMRRAYEQENDALNQLALTGRAQAYAEADTDYNRDLNRINALLSGSQVSQPGFVNTPQSRVANTDYAGQVWNKFNADTAAAERERQAQQSALGGFLSAAALPIMYSDKRLKEDIAKVGETPDDVGIYSYRYKGGGPRRLGLIAQDVEKKKPEAVVTGRDGLKMVDYRKALHLGERASQTGGLGTTPRPHPFRDPDRFKIGVGHFFSNGHQARSL